MVIIHHENRYNQSVNLLKKEKLMNLYKYAHATVFTDREFLKELKNIF